MKFLIAAGLLFCFQALAQTEATPNEAAVMAQQGTKAGAPACVNCHGAKGEGIAASGFPRLAGILPAAYFVKQLDEYASGVRANPVMMPIAKALTAKEREQLAEYYANMSETPKAPKSKASASVLKLGERLARVGDGKLQLQACNNCHGPDGVGNSPGIPGLSGQHSKYLEAQLLAWKQGQRKNSPLQMASVAERLDEKSIQALSAYFEQVRTR